MRLPIFMHACLCLLLPLVGGCGRSPQPAVPEDSHETTAPVRVVSLAPNLTEMICAIGAADRLVGRTNVCDYPADALRGVPVVGGFGAPSLERLVEARPTLVVEVDLADESVARKIRHLGMAHRRVPCRTLADIPVALRTLGALLGCEAAAEAQATAFEADLARLRAALPPAAERPTVYAEIWGDPAMTAGKDSLVGELITLAGGRNLGDAFSRDYVQVSTEWVIKEDPAVILCFYELAGTSPRAAVARRTGWGLMRAVRAGSVHDGFDINLVLKPGPRVLQSVPLLRAAILGVAAPADRPSQPREAGHGD